MIACKKVICKLSAGVCAGVPRSVFVKKGAIFDIPIFFWGGGVVKCACARKSGGRAMKKAQHNWETEVEFI